MVFAMPRETRFQLLQSVHCHRPLPQSQWATVANQRLHQHAVMAAMQPTTSYPQSQSELQPSMDRGQARTRHCVQHPCRHLLCRFQREFMGSRGHQRASSNHLEPVVLPVLLLALFPALFPALLLVLLAVMTSDGTQPALPPSSHLSEALAHQ